MPDHLEGGVARPAEVWRDHQGRPELGDLLGVG